MYEYGLMQIGNCQKLTQSKPLNQFFFILSKMQSMFNQFLNQWSTYLDRRCSKTNLIKDLNTLESSGYFWFAFNRGYSQSKTVSKNSIILNIVVDLWSVLATVRFLLLAIFSSDLFKIMLGDHQLGIPGEDAFNLLSFIAASMFLIVHLSIGYLEWNNNFTIIRVFHQIRQLHFNLDKIMGSYNCSNFRRVFFFMSQSHFIMTKVTCVGTAGLFITNMVLFDASKYKNDIISYKQFFFLELIWLAIIIVPMVVLIHNVFWSFTHIILLIVYTSLCLDFLYSSTDSNNQLVPATVLIDIFIKKQNYYYNQLLITERQLSPITLAGYIIGSLMADFALFYGLFIKTGSVLFNVLTITLGIVAFGALTLLNIIAATTVDKVKKCRLMNYWIIRSGQSKTLSSRIKLIAIFERLSTHPVGFFVGRLFVIDNHRFLLFLLENISILLLFITNMTRLWKN